MAKVAYINTIEDGICVWVESLGDFVPLKQLEEHYERVANEMGTSLYDDGDGKEEDN